MRILLAAAALAAGAAGLALADEGHDHGAAEPPAEEGGHHDAPPTPGHEMLERMPQMHADHAHQHDFAAMEGITPGQMERVMNAMLDLGLAVPSLDAARGRELFLETGCVVCHPVSGVGGRIGPSLNARDMPEPMNTFEFAARMWRGAPAMVEMQQDLFGEAIELTGKELADLIAFAHDEAEQARLAPEQIPERYRDLIAN